MFLASDKEVTAETWHRRFSHLLDCTEKIYIGKYNTVQHVAKVSKQHRLAFPKNASKAENVLDLFIATCVAQ